MIHFPGYEQLIDKVQSNGQGHVFSYWNELSDTGKKSLLDDLSSVDFGTLSSLYLKATVTETVNGDFGPAPYITRPASPSDDSGWKEAHSAGIDLIRKGKVAVFIVAGGQGSRLGYDGPKGAFRMSPVKNKSLFQIHAEKVKKCSMKYGVSIPLFIMTSDVNHAATAAHFAENKNFGLDDRDLILFPQNMIPSLNTEGKLILSSKNSIFKNPDGHGGSLTALRTSGALDRMKHRGIEIISYFQVDNPLVNLVDPWFTGFHALNQAEVSSKALIKAYPDEKIGSFVRYADGSESVVEYSDLPKEKMFEKRADGSLAFGAGSIAIHLFDRGFIERITSGGEISLPFHVARKKIKEYAGGAIRETDGFKFEKFVFDALPLAKKSVIIETVREEEFAPVKNATGVDSVESSQKLMDGLFRSWLTSRGIAVPSGVKRIEISPLVAVEPDDIPGNLSIPDEENIYIG